MTEGDVIVPPLSPVASVLERAITLFAFLSGRLIAYPKRHGRVFRIASHNGEEYPVLADLPEGGAVKNWGEDNPVHILGHSLGGNTARALVQLLKEDFFGCGTSEKWVLSITCCSTPFNGSLMVSVLGSKPDVLNHYAIEDDAAEMHTLRNPTGPVLEEDQEPQERRPGCCERAKRPSEGWWQGHHPVRWMSFGYMLGFLVQVLETLSCGGRSPFRLESHELSVSRVGVWNALVHLMEAGCLFGRGSRLFQKLNSAPTDLSIHGAMYRNAWIEHPKSVYLFSYVGDLFSSPDPVFLNEHPHDPEPHSQSELEDDAPYPESSAALLPTMQRYLEIWGLGMFLWLLTWWPWRDQDFSALGKEFRIRQWLRYGGHDGLVEVFSQLAPLQWKRVDKQWQATPTPVEQDEAATPKPGVWHIRRRRVDHLAWFRPSALPHFHHRFLRKLLTDLDHVEEASHQ